MRKVPAHGEEIPFFDMRLGEYQDKVPPNSFHPPRRPPSVSWTAGERAMIIPGSDDPRVERPTPRSSLSVRGTLRGDPTMLVGYVSDERYVAIPDVLLEWEGASGSVEARSRATGAVHADLQPGAYRVTLQKPGFGAKSVDVTVGGGGPYQFRLLADGLLGYAWPKWVRSGEKSEFRVHAVEAYTLGLWRYGLRKESVRNLGWFDEHGPRATMQVSPDGDYTRTGVGWNKRGYTNPHHLQYVEAPERSGLYYFHATTAGGLAFSFPWIVAPARPAARVAVLASNITWNAYNSFGGRSNYINADRLPPRPTVNSRLELKRYTDPDSINYDTDDYAPLSFDRPEAINHINASEQVSDPIEGRAACHLAPAEWRLLARARRIRIRLLCRDPVAFGPPRPRRLLGPDPQHASRVLVEADVRPG